MRVADSRRNHDAHFFFDRAGAIEDDRPSIHLIPPVSPALNQASSL